jgi:Tfp pilus assembly protein FimT
MITVAVIAIITGIAAPNIKGIMQRYRLRTASTDLVSYVNMAKTRAAKHNRQWHIDLNPIGFNGYQVYYNNTGGVKVVVASINFDTCEDKSMYEKCYVSIIYKSPDDSSVCAEKEFVFSSNGLTNICAATIAIKQHDDYYRVGLLAASGLVRTQKWNGSGWE